tara:strand:+ start:314 stop:1369 length:1056 start_codon:yes stop_codon:yes gene_type:complete
MIQKNISLTNKTFVLMALASFSLSGCSFSDISFSNSCNMNNSKKDFRIEELKSEYDKNPIAFDSDFKNKCIGVIGAVDSISTNLGYRLTLEGFETRFLKNDKYYRRFSTGMAVVANFPERAVNSLREIRTDGPPIRVYGRLSSIIDDVSFYLVNSTIDSTYSGFQPSIVKRKQNEDIKEYYAKEIDNFKRTLEIKKARVSRGKEILANYCGIEGRPNIHGLYYNPKRNQGSGSSFSGDVFIRGGDGRRESSDTREICSLEGFNAARDIFYNSIDAPPNQLAQAEKHFERLQKIDFSNCFTDPDDCWEKNYPGFRRKNFFKIYNFNFASGRNIKLNPNYKETERGPSIQFDE